LFNRTAGKNFGSCNKSKIMCKLISTFLYLLPLFLLGQNEIAIEIDGRLTESVWSEKNMLDSDDLILVEDADNYYLAIKTGTNVMVNVFIKNGDELLILHSSMSIGKATYELSDSVGTLKKGFSAEASSWDFRDPSLRKEESNIDTNEELIECFEKNGWASNTMNLGNTGETEYVISKKMIPEGSSICIHYGMFTPAVFPANSSTTTSKSGDKMLHMANTEERVIFRILNWLEF
jgi:hypothetical protein